MTTPVRQPIWFVCSAATAPCLYAADVVLALRADPPCCIRHRALLLSSPRHDGWTREAVLRDVNGEIFAPNISPPPGQFEIGAMLRDRRRP